jgi:dihydroorotate dehydrogenase
MYSKIKPILFQIEPEVAHNIGEKVLRVIPKCKLISSSMTDRNFVSDSRLSQNILDIEFINPVGLAAGFDKNATMVNSMLSLGFGFTEIGTVTPKPQSGNPKPRLFRFPQYESIQNAMGFNNRGCYDVMENMKKVYPFSIPIGVNIGKNKSTPEEDALSDYESLIEKFSDLGDYLVINISSPNTPNLRDLQNEEFIKKLFELAKSITQKPIFLKIAPDMDANVAISLCKKAVESGADGIIATNTTTDYTLLPNSKDFGGVSGKVLANKSYKLFKAIAKELYGKTVLISVGGISTADEAYKRIKAGASLVQCYSGLIFKGPSMARDINLGILELLEQDGYSHISEAIGSDLSKDD